MNKLHLIQLLILLAIAMFAAGCQSQIESTATNTPVLPSQPNTLLQTPTAPSIEVPPLESLTHQQNPSNQVINFIQPTENTQEDLTTPLVLSESPPIPQQTEDCLDEAAFYSDVTIPDGTLLDAGVHFSKTWQVRNTGTCTWGDGYALVFASGDMMSGSLNNPIPQVAPGEIVDISVELVAPARGGEHTGNWEFQNARGDRYGVGTASTGYIWVQIQVAWLTASNYQPNNPDPAAPSTTLSNCQASEDTGVETQILNLVNTARADQGLTELTLDPTLTQAAREHSRDMACQDFVGHSGSDGSTWYDRVANQGYTNAITARENIYVGDPANGGTADGAFSWWMNSQAHRDNILYSTITEIGIGYVYNPGSTYGGYYTAVFARP